jgi:cell wall-associated NlpC family hydrolase
MLVPMHFKDPLELTFLPLLLVAAGLVTGCASGPERPQPITRSAPVVPLEQFSLGTAVAELAMGMVGTPYRYGGTDPKAGFDCSGLVYYAYDQAGHRVPRTSREQFRAARKIALGEVDAGDVMFFQDQEKLSHVGIYIGDGLFVHAPANGQRVTVASIHAPYYQSHLVAVGRLLPSD